jgi:pimeloyl-ACP methyl ester carboxylesterase
MIMNTPRLHYTAFDQNPESAHPRIAFCHGLFGQGRNWTTIGKQLSDRYAVTLIDLPNHGRSDWTESLDYPDIADLVANFLRDLGGADQWTLVGHSMGGKIAMMLALRHPELVQRLCVVDIAPVDYGGRGEFSGYVRAMRGLDLSALSSREQADRQLAADISDPTVRGFLLQNLRRDRTPGAATGWRWQMNLKLLGDQLEVLSGWPDPGGGPYSGPTLWVAGAESDYIRDENVPAMRAHFPQVRKIKIKGARHWVHSEQPEIFGQVLAGFLGRPG